MIHVPRGHPWHSIHRSHVLFRCDNTLFCTQCAGTSSGNSVPWMGAACVPNCRDRREQFPNRYWQVDRRLAKGRCPYSGDWKSGLHRSIVWPPVEAYLVEDDNSCHTKCTCHVCCDRPPDGPHTDASNFRLSRQAAGALNDRDWAELAALYDIHAPLSCLTGPDDAAAGEHAGHEGVVALSPPAGGGHHRPSQSRAGTALDPTVEEVYARLSHLTSDAA